MRRAAPTDDLPTSLALGSYGKPRPSSPTAGAGRRTEQGPVRREPIPKEELERDVPSLRGKLDPPAPADPPSGVEVREGDDGARIVSINIHQAVPGGHELDRGNQDIDALRDVAAYVNSVDADVVAVQEVHDHEGPDGVPHQASVLFHLLDADDMAFTPALGHEGYAADDEREYGTATYTRNGYEIEQAHDVDLPNDQGRIEDRSAGVVAVRAPDGERTTVVNAHLTSKGEEAPLRRDQLGHLAGIVEQVEETGSFDYREAIGEGDASASGLAGDVVVVGDLNARRTSDTDPDALLGEAGLRHASEDGRSWWGRTFGGTPHGDAIDHLYRSDGLRATGYDVLEIPPDELDGDGLTPTDHPIVIVDVERD